MKPYYENGDRVTILSNSNQVHNLLLKTFEEKGREKIVAEILGTTGTVVGVVEGMGHKEVLYRPDGVTHSWKIPTFIIQKQTQ